MDRDEFFVSMEIWERVINFRWEIVIIYSPTDHRCSAAFLEELHAKNSRVDSRWSWGAISI